jgi:long-subunit fatty acid transport protein
MKRITVLFLFIVLILINSNLFAGGNGGYAGAYLRMGLGARSIALGNAGTADMPNGCSLYYNPALLGFMDGKIVSLSYSFLSLDRRFQFISYSMKVPPGAGFAVGWIESGDDDFDGYNSIGQESGTISHSASAIYFSFSRKFHPKFSIGVSIKILLEYINDGTDEFDYSSKGVGFDFGAVYHFNDQLTFAAVLREIGSKFKANTDKIFQQGGTTIDRFPKIYRIGARYITPYDWLRVLYDFEWSDKEAYKHHIGLEAVRGQNLALRLGLNEGNFAAGAGMDFKIYKFNTHLDYAFMPSIIDEGSSHIFSWQFFIN